MKVAIMQPTYLPWAGYFDLMDQVDLFVYLDSVQFVKRSWQQRNRVKTPNGLRWLTVPVVSRGRFDQLICEVEVGEPGFWREHTRTIELNYRRAPYFSDSFYTLVSILERDEPWIRLVDLNIRLIEWLSEMLGLKTPTVRSSNLAVDGKRSGLLAAICQSVGATEYLSPMGSFVYLSEEIREFSDRAIDVSFHNYAHPTYRQLFPPFLPFASVIDLLFNEGMRAIDFISSGRRRAYSPEEVPVRSGRLG